MTTRHQIYLDLHKMYAESLKKLRLHKLEEIDQWRAIVVLKEPGTTFYMGELLVMRWGTLMLHGDISTVSWSGFYSDTPYTWRDVIVWMAKAEEQYLISKATREMGTRAVETLDPDVLRTDLCGFRRRRPKALSRELARGVLRMAQEEGCESARRLFYDLTGDSEAASSLGECIDSRLVMGQAFLRRALELVGRNREDYERLRQVA